MFGQDQQDLFTTADPVKDKNTLLSFVELANKKTKISTDPAKPNVATIVVGENDWPMPIPLVKRNGKWIFDTKAGHNEILYRRIGSNELDAIAICHNYVAAQLAYSASRHDGAIVNQYAQKIISTPGKQDGLYWKNADGSDGGPLSEGIAKAIEEGYSVEKPTAYHGYYFKILKGQGPAAPIGRIDYVIQGAMIGGFALVAYPAQYRVTGVKTFIVSQDGVVYQKDLGPDTLTTARQMELYNPDKTWQPTEDSWPDTSDTTATASN
jgi:hypothetical protein